MKLGLYSVSYSGIWYRGDALEIGDFIRRAKAAGYTGVEIDGKRPHGNPMDLDAQRRQEIRAIADHEGMDLVALAANNDFSSPVPDQHESQLVMVREQIKLAHDLGIKLVRVFLAWPGLTYRNGVANYDIARRRWEETWRDTTRIEIWDQARASFRELADFAESLGVTLALQNHGPVIRHYRDVLDMIAEVDSPALKACFDVPLEPRQDDDWVFQAARQTGALQMHTHASGEFKRLADGEIVQHEFRYGSGVPNYPAFVNAMEEIGFDGYLCFEYCHPALDDLHVLRDRAFVDEQVELAFEYFSNLIANASAARQPVLAGVK